jgi:hypothetical protein
MTAGRLDLVCEQGATFRRVLTWTAGGAPVDLSGWTAEMQVRRRHDAAEPEITLSTADGRITLGGSAGTVTLELGAAETSALTADTSGKREAVPAATPYVYDLELTAPDGSVTRLVEGLFKLHAEVTQ